MNKSKQTQRDAWLAAQIARSSRFVACLFLGCGQYDKRSTDSLAGARKLRAKMRREYQNDLHLRSRPIMIYAVTDGDNLSIHVE